MKTLKDFTPEVQAKIPEYINRALKGVFDGGRYNSFSLEKAQDAVYNIYSKCGYKKPVVLVSGNPYETQVIFHHIKNNPELQLAIYFNYCLQNGLSIGKPLPQLYSQLYSQLDSQLRSQLDSQLYSQLRSQKITYVDDYLYGLNVYSDAYFQWFRFMANELKIDANINQDLELFSSKQEQSGVYSAIFTELVCVVTKYPKKVHRNTSNDLHCASGSAVEWEYNTDATKFECHYVNGRYVEPELFHKINSMTFEEFSQIENEDQKGIVITAIKENKGNNGLMQFLGAVEVDKKTVKHTEDYSEVITLFKTKKKFSFLQNSKGEMNQPYAWIHMICPSTKTEYLIDTCPTFKDAIECAKWHRPKQVPLELIYNWQSAN